MVAACRSYITCNGKCQIWDQDAEDIIRKMKVTMTSIYTSITYFISITEKYNLWLYLWQECICLYEEYQSCFQKSKKQAMERLGKRSFDVSEMLIFRKFKGFCKQLEMVQSTILFFNLDKLILPYPLQNNKHCLLKVTQIISVFRTFEPLGNSNIEGIEILARQFHTVSMNLKRKQYDVLAPVTAEFQSDFAKFMAQINHIEVCIISFCVESATHDLCIIFHHHFCFLLLG